MIEPGPGPIKEIKKVERADGYTWGGRRPEQKPGREERSEPAGDSRLATAVALLIAAATMLVGWFWLK
jgi:hypothetical protein